MNAIALIGLSGSGKSTVGLFLAERLGLPHLDVDLVLEQREGRTIREIFDTDGEPYFRALEREITIELLDAPGVLSLGTSSSKKLSVRCGLSCSCRMGVILTRRSIPSASAGAKNLRGGEDRSGISLLLVVSLTFSANVTALSRSGASVYCLAS